VGLSRSITARRLRLLLEGDVALLFFFKCSGACDLLCLASSRAAQLGGYASPGGMRDLLVAIDAGFVVWNVLNDRGDVAFLCVRFALARQQPRGPAGGVCLPEGNAGFVGGWLPRSKQGEVEMGAGGLGSEGPGACLEKAG
jgi:hypothetical protein